MHCIQTHKSVFLIILSLIYLLSLVGGMTSPRQVTPTTKYSYTGTQVFPTGTYYPTGSATVNSLNYKISFPTAMNDTLYRSGMSIQEIYSQIGSRIYNLTFYWDTSMPKSTTSFNIAIWSSIMNKIQTLTMRYLLIASNWGEFDFDWYMYTTPGDQLNSANSFTQTFTGLPAVNMTGGVSTFACLSGFDVTAASTVNQLSLILTVTRTSSTSLSYTVSSTSATKITFRCVTFLAFFFNMGQINAIPAKITMGTLATNSGGTLRFLDPTLIVRQYNTFFGLQAVSINNESFISWNGVVTTNTSIDITSNNAFLYFRFIYIIFQENWCIQSTPYLILATSTCYDVCPDGYYQNNIGLTCERCLYDCFQCTNGTACSACDNTTDFRQMNISSKRCIPLPGYYDTGANQQVASLCNNSCLTCITNATKCTSCKPGFYLSAFTCFACVDVNCNNCTSGTSCLGCIIPYSLSGNTCVLNCTLAVADCSTCNPSGNTTICDGCLLGFFLNTTDNTCSIICGDGILASTQQCDDDNNDDDDGCSSNCTIQASFFCTGAVGNTSNCSSCMLNCLNCTSLTTCSQCQTLYQFNSTTSGCEPDCTLVSDCVSCQVVSSNISCNGCITGYEVDSSNFTCVTRCGDGIIVGSEQCDDNNTNKNDGCSSTCIIEAAFFCEGTPSVCYPCNAFCNSCLNNTSCTSCNALAPWNTTSISCSPNCTNVNFCSTCDLLNPNTESEFVKCLNCTTGFQVDQSNNACIPICGDGLVVDNEACDDNNTIDGDGCSSVCIVQPTFYCEDAPSQCYHCLQYCLMCTSATTCSNCNSITIWSAISSVCFANCSNIDYCLSCQVSTSLSGDYIQCLSCSGGYSVDPTVNLCQPICGDGILAPQQRCDDGNKVNGDGCDSICQVEQYYTCNTSAVTQMSQCFLSQLNFLLIDMMKLSNQNAGMMSFQPTPANLPIYNSINWTSLISVPNSSVTITSAKYDPVTNRVIVDFNYSSSIDSSQIQLLFNTTGNPQLIAVSPFNISIKAQSDDNQSLEYYSESSYSLAKITQYLALVVAALAILFLICGIFGGRLIGLQCAGVIQLSFISTLTLQKLSPSFNSLQILSYSLGYNRIKSYDYSQTIDRPFKSAELSPQYIYNYNAMGALVMIPVLLALVCKIVSKLSKDTQRQTYWNTKAKYCIGEFTLYALLSFSYLAFLSLFIELKYSKYLTIDLIGIVIGVIVAVVTFFYLFCYAKAGSFYTQFKQKFEADGFSSRFYIFIILERIVAPALLVQLGSKVYTSAAIIGIYVLLGILVVLKKPYKGAKQNIRPFANYLIVIVIEGIFLLVNYMKNPTGIISIYAPLAILGLLLICVTYSAYALIKDLRSSYQLCQKEAQQSEEPNKLEETQMRDFAAKLMNKQQRGILDQSGFLQTKPRKDSDAILLEDENSPRKFSLSSVKDKICALKKTQLENGGLLDDSIQFDNMGKVLEELNCSF